MPIGRRRPTPPLQPPPPPPPWRPIEYDTAAINACFRQYELSFRDPNDFVEKLLELNIRAALAMMNRAPGRAQTDLVRREEDRVARAGHAVVHEILQYVARQTEHRHRIDARNIEDEYRRQLSGMPASRLIPDPQERPNQHRPRRRPRLTPRVYDSDDGEEEEATTRETWYLHRLPPVRSEGEVLPMAQIMIPEHEEGLREVNPPRGNQEALEFLAVEHARGREARDAIFAILSAGTNNRGLDPPEYMDDPLEVVLPHRDDMELITAPAPPVDQTKLDETQWPELEIYDLRAGGRATHGMLSSNHYITNFIEVVRRVVSHPEVAKKFAIVLRGHPTRYQEGSPDELGDEPPPTTEEGQFVITISPTNSP